MAPVITDDISLRLKAQDSANWLNLTSNSLEISSSLEILEKKSSVKYPSKNFIKSFCFARESSGITSFLYFPVIVATDTSDGTERLVDGVEVRIRCSDIGMYQATGPGEVAIWFRGESNSEAIEIMATVAEVDKIMARDNLKEVIGNG